MVWVHITMSILHIRQHKDAEILSVLSSRLLIFPQQYIKHLLPRQHPFSFFLTKKEQCAQLIIPTSLCFPTTKCNHVGLHWSHDVWKPALKGTNWACPSGLVVLPSHFTCNVNTGVWQPEGQALGQNVKAGRGKWWQQPGMLVALWSRCSHMTQPTSACFSPQRAMVCWVSFADKPDPELNISLLTTMPFNFLFNQIKPCSRSLLLNLILLNLLKCSHVCSFFPELPRVI